MRQVPAEDTSRAPEGLYRRALESSEAAAEVANDTPLFQSLNASQLGLDFRHQWQPKDQHEASLLKTGFTGGGVCAGDYDGDGRVDVLLTRPHGGPRLYRNLGNFRFEDVTSRAGVGCEGAWTTGAAFVDVNNDGQLDLVICAYESPVYLFLNQGDGRFKNVAADVGIDFSGASVKMVFADYDRDGDLDGFLVTNRREPRKAVDVKYLGGPGNYEVAPEFQELVQVINLPNGEQKFAKAGQANHFFHNDLVETGTLSFRDLTDTAGFDGFYHGLDATWWDYNRDGFPDLYIANDFTDPDQFFRNNGDGTFTDIALQALPSTPWFAMGAAVGDVNGDGLFDMLVTDMSGTSHYRQKMAMGSMDAVAWFLDTAEPRQYMRNMLYVNSGTDRFLEAAQMAGLASSDWTWSVKFADLDNDGLEDVYTTNGFTRDYLNSDFNLQLKQSGREGDSLAWYEAPELREANLAFRNDGHLHFGSVAKAWGLDEVGISFGAAFADLDGDGDQDLIVNNFDAPCSLLKNQSTNHRAVLQLEGTKSNRLGYGAVIEIETPEGRQIRYANPHNGFMSCNDPQTYVGLGSAESIDRITINWPSGTQQVLTGVPANSHLRIVEPDGDQVASSEDARGATQIVSRHHARTTETQFKEASIPNAAAHQEQPFDDFQTQPLLPNKLSQLGPGLAWADVDGDGDDDVFVGGAAGQPGQLLLNRGDGEFDQYVPAALQADQASEDMGAAFLDYDADGLLDLLVVSGGVEAPEGDPRLQDRIYRGEGIDASGRPTFTRSHDVLPDLRQSGSSVALADFDGDGDVDLFVGTRVVPGQYPRSSASRLLRNDGGRFVDITQELAPSLVEAGMVTAAVWCDVDQDDDVDLALATEYGPIRLLVNEQGRLTEQTTTATQAAGFGWWNGITAADVDGDGDLDLAATNFGRNTKYHPSPEHPQLIFYGDFEGTGAMHIVEAKSTGSSLLPVRGRSCSSNAMPFLKDRFQTYHSFASATLDEIYTANSLENALQKQVTHVDSLVLINEGTGKFTAAALPELAQIAPAFGVQFLYANDDADLDLFLAQNFYVPQRETGRMNGGLSALLLQSSDGQWNQPWPDQSGIQIPGQSMAASVIDLNGDGWPDVFVSVNNQAPMSLLQQGSPVADPPIQVRLTGPRANSQAAGAKVVVHYENGLTRIAQVIQGDGYLNQGIPVAWFPRSDALRPVSAEVRWPDGAVQSVAYGGEFVWAIRYPSATQ